MNKPVNAPPKMHAKAINAIVTELMVSFVWRASYGGVLGAALSSDFCVG
jgi:hypothetical protein